MSLTWGSHGDWWTPEGGEHRDWRDLRPGDLLAFDRAIWRVIETRPVPVIDWDDDDREHYEQMKGNGAAEEEWRFRPLNLILVPAAGGKREHYEVKPYVGLRARAYVLHPHYPVCADCGQPWPCRELDINREAGRQSEELDRLAGIMPGCCWSCGEPVTSRQASIVFDGENLLLPGAPAPVFHLRSGKPYCRTGAAQYEERWVAAGEGRPWRLRCPGKVTRHVDGPECDRDDCPGLRAYHAESATHVLTRGGAVLRWARDCERCAGAAGLSGYRWLPDDECRAALGWQQRK